MTATRAFLIAAAAASLWAAGSAQACARTSLAEPPSGGMGVGQAEETAQARRSEALAKHERRERLARIAEGPGLRPRKAIPDGALMGTRRTL
ncbi:MAG: hypothetical protein NW203_05285 [Hyphomonadaceae bacterium]|nr:hypothetical protein [Hyphomonadaceae bacterium]